MSSVVVGCSGRCPDPRSRARLIGHLQRLAELSDRFLRAGSGEQLGLAAIRGRNGRAIGRARANIVRVSEAISSPVLVSSAVMRDRNAFLAAAQDANLPATEDPDTGCASVTLRHDIRLSGLDFRLFGPRGTQSHGDRLSFVFLETGAAPFLDGRLVQVESAEQYASVAGEIADEAGYSLGAPRIEIDGYREDWTDLLFSWVKYFFIGDLWWRRFEDLQGYEGYRAVFCDVQETLGSDGAEQATFDAILATFTQHAEHWSEDVADADVVARVDP